MKYLVAADYDRTLAAEEDKFILKQNVRDAINEFSSSYQFVVVSGRTWRQISKLSNGLKPSAWVLENGCYILTENKKISNFPENWYDIREKVLKSLEKMGFKYSLGDVIIFVDNAKDREKEFRRLSNEMPEISIEFNRNDAMILPKNINKGSGLKRYLEEISFNGKIIAVGDGENDVSLFDVADVKVAVSNAVKMLKEKANIILSKPDGEGILELLEMIKSERL